jgi:hypothetical protein
MKSYANADYSNAASFFKGAFAELQNKKGRLLSSSCLFVRLSVSIEQLSFRWTYLHEI